MITLDCVYIYAGLTFAAFSTLTVLYLDHPRRFGTAAFWGLLAVSFLFGSYLGDLGNGVLVLALAALAGLRLLGQSNPPTTSPAEQTQAGEGRQGEDQDPVAEVAKVGPEQEADGQQAPEGRRPEAARMVAIKHGQGGKGGEGQAGEDIDPVERNHWPAP